STPRASPRSRTPTGIASRLPGCCPRRWPQGGTGSRMATACCGTSTTPTGSGSSTIATGRTRACSACSTASGKRRSPTPPPAARRTSSCRRRRRGGCTMHFWGIDELGEAIRSRAVSPVEVLDATLDRIEQYDPVLRSYAHVSIESARAAAQEAERAVQAGEWRGPLHGVPIAVKDLYGTADAPTSFGSAHLK